jgi:cation transporter-like permease
MQNSLDFATALGGFAVAISAIVLAWVTYHWQAIRRRELSPASFIELALLVLFVLVVTAWIVEAQRAS